MVGIEPQIGRQGISSSSSSSGDGGVVVAVVVLLAGEGVAVTILVWQDQ